MKSPRSLGPAYVAEYDAVFPRLAKKYGALYYPFFLDGVVLDRTLIQADGLHPNPAGVDVIAGKMTPLVTQLVQRVQAAPAKSAQ